jgi:hypothetical protein
VLLVVDRGLPGDEVRFGRRQRPAQDSKPDSKPDSEPSRTDAGAEPPARSSARRAALGVVVAVGSLAAAAAVVGRGEDAGSRAAILEAERAATSTASPSTNAPTSQRERPVSSFSEIRLGAPLSPVPTGGTIVYGLSEAGQVVRIDLEEGGVQSRQLQSPSGEPPGAEFRVVARAGAALLTNDERDVLVVPDGAGTRTDWRPGWGKVFPADRPGEVWRVSGDLSGDRQAVLEKLDGTDVDARLPLPAGSRAVGTDRAGGMQFDNLGQRYRVRSPDSGSELLAETPLLASNDAVLVRVDCTDPGVCRWIAEDRVSGGTVEGDAPLALVVPGPSAVLSPDNRYLARVSGRDDSTSLTVLDLQEGTSRVVTADLDADQAPVWTSAGNQLLFLDNRGELHRFDPATGEAEIVCGTCFGPLVSLDAVAPDAVAPDRGAGPAGPGTTVPATDETAVLPTTPLSLAP